MTVRRHYAVSTVDGPHCTWGDDGRLTGLVDGAYDEASWLVGYDASGPVWGRKTASGWQLAPTFAPAGRSWWIRAFCEDGELLIRPTVDGERGHRLQADPGAEPPLQERILLESGVVEMNGDFARVTAAGGAHCLVPAEGDVAANAVSVHRYWEEDDDTGVMRLGPWRLVDVHFPSPGLPAGHG